MRLSPALAIAFAIGFSCSLARADDYKLLQSCVETANAACLEEVGLGLAERIEDPRARSLMMARFALIDWTSGSRVEGNTGLLRAWSHLAEISNEGCLPRVDATLAFEQLTGVFGDKLASRVVLRRLVQEASAWPKDTAPKCSRPSGESHWLARVAERQRALGDREGLRATLDLALAWGLDPEMRNVDFAPLPGDAASLLASHGRAGDALRVCEANRDEILDGLGESADAEEKSEGAWRALGCYRSAGLKEAARTFYREFARAKLDAIGLAQSGDGDDGSLGLAVWDLVQGMSWDDPVFAASTAESMSRPRVCFDAPNAQCLSIHAMRFVESQKRGAARRVSYGTAPDFRSAGALDGFARFLVGADGDLVGDQARSWFLTQAQQAPPENLRVVVGDAVAAGDLIWARRIFYAWYTEGGEAYFHHLTNPSQDDKSEISEETWPLHVAWSIARMVGELDPAFEPEELASFAETAWDDGIAQLPALRDIPPTELIDSDERSGAHILDLCFRNAFGEWAAKLFAHAHLPDRAAEARAILPEAARDCAFARRSIGPILRTASWYAAESDMKQARALLLEGADRLTRPHYHVYDDADPELGGAALAAIALGFERGILVPPPYDSVF